MTTTTTTTEITAYMNNMISHPETLALRVPWGVVYRASRRID